MKKFSSDDPKEIEEALKDPNTVITELKLTMENENKDPNSPVKVEGFNIDADFLVSMYDEAIRLNGTEITASFYKCANLGNATIRITLELPEE